MTERMDAIREAERDRIAALAAQAHGGEWPDDRLDYLMVLLHNEARYPVSEQHMHGHLEYMRSAFVLLVEEVRALRERATNA